MKKDAIQKHIEDLLKTMNVGCDSIVCAEPSGDGHLRFLIQTPDHSLLIGAQGENLTALNYVMRRIVDKAMGAEKPLKFSIDVNGYQEKILESLKAKAKILSDRARSFKVDVELDPMSSYERMLVHSYLEGQPNIKTESRGEGRERRIVIRYVEDSI